MPLMSILAAAQNGNYFSDVAKACGISVSEAEAGLGKLCPAIATQLKAKAQKDPDAFESLLDLLDEGGDPGDLTDSEAAEDGNAVLADIYGSPAAAMAEMKKRAPGLDAGSLERLSAIAATGVLWALGKANPAPAALAAVPAESGGILATIITALFKGLMQSLARQLAPKRRRRRYTNYFGTRRRKTTRRRKQTISLDDIFGQILGTRKN